MSLSDLIVENSTFPAVRADINGALQALGSNQANETAPTTTYPCEFWADLTANLLKIRNTGNIAWLTVGRLNQSFLGITPTDIGGLSAANNLADTANKASARTNIGVTYPAKNALINGRFEIKQRGGSFTAGAVSNTSTYVKTLDRWQFGASPDGAGSSATCTISQQIHSPGQSLIPFNPSYFIRVSNSTQGTSLGANSYHLLSQYIENVYTFSGESITFSFYARSSIPGKVIAIELAQTFANGGSPSAPVFGIGASQISLSSSWVKYERTINIPSISGKTFGTDGTSALVLSIFFQAGSTISASRTGGATFSWQGTGDIDISDVQLERGSFATVIDDRPFGQELQLCRRYYQKSYNYETVPGTATTIGSANIIFPSTGTGIAGLTVNFTTTMRTAPSVVSYDAAGAFGRCSKGADGKIAVADQIGTNSARIYTNDTTSSNYFLAQWTADAEY